MAYGSETWAMNIEQEQRLERAEMRMVRWMCDVSLREKKTSSQLRQMLGIEAVGDVVRRGRLRWLGHVLRTDESEWVKKCFQMQVEGTRSRGRLKLTWEQAVEQDMKAHGLKREDAKDMVKWRHYSWGVQGQPPL